MTTFTLQQVLDLADAEGRVRYAEGFLAGLSAGDRHQASEWADLTAAALEAQTHDAAHAAVAGLVDAPLSRTFTSIGVDPVTADAETLRRVAAFWRHAETQRVRAHVAKEVAA